MTEIGRTLPVTKSITTESSPERIIKCTNENEELAVYDCYEKNPLLVGTSGPLFCDKKGS